MFSRHIVLNYIFLLLDIIQRHYQFFDVDKFFIILFEITGIEIFIKSRWFMIFTFGMKFVKLLSTFLSRLMFIFLQKNGRNCASSLQNFSILDVSRVLTIGLFSNGDKSRSNMNSQLNNKEIRKIHVLQQVEKFKYHLYFLWYLASYQF